MFDRFKEVSPPTVPGNAVSRDGDRFSIYDTGSSSRGKRPNSSAVSISTEEVISSNNGVDSAYWEVKSSSKCSYSIGSAVLSHAATTNFGFVDREKL